MRTLKVFNTISLDGYFCDLRGDMSWAHAGQDAEWMEWTSNNARGSAALLFGRVTYEMMASFWSTPAAEQAMPEVAAGMNGAEKVVFSRSLKNAAWANTRLAKGDLADEVRKLKREVGATELVLMGSGQIVAQLAAARLVDEYQLVLHPTVLGGGRTLFDGLPARLELKLRESRTFRNGNVVLSYVDPTASRDL